MYDFNCRDINEPFFQDSPVVETKLAAFLQEIDILLSTEHSTVFGKRNFGNDVEKMLWKTTYNSTAISRSIGRAIADNCSTGENFEWQTDFAVTKGTNRDIGILTVTIKDKETKEELTTSNYVFK